MTTQLFKSAAPEASAIVANLHASANSRAKRMVDIAFSILALVVAAPLILLIGLLVASTSPGAILFRQERVGLGGRRFSMLKFRTMRQDSNDSVHRDYVLSMVRETPEGSRREGAFKLAGDPRITPVGAILRRTSLDELPQFLNVLVGDMSVVGPRPPLPYEVDEYADWQMERLTARPGITGLWQVSGRNNLSYVDMCLLDLKYLREWSLAGDLWIIVRTPWVMLTNSGRAG